MYLILFLLLIMNKLNDLNFEIECISGTRKVINNQSEAEIQL